MHDTVSCGGFRPDRSDEFDGSRREHSGGPGCGESACTPGPRYRAVDVVTASDGPCDDRTDNDRRDDVRALFEAS
jgi:hypothetical protein